MQFIRQFSSVVSINVELRAEWIFRIALHFLQLGLVVRYVRMCLSFLPPEKSSKCLRLHKAKVRLIYLRQKSINNSQSSAAACTLTEKHNTEKI